MSNTIKADIVYDLVKYKLLEGKSTKTRLITKISLVREHKYGVLITCNHDTPTNYTYTEGELFVNGKSLQDYNYNELILIVAGAKAKYEQEKD